MRSRGDVARHAVQELEVYECWSPNTELVSPANADDLFPARWYDIMAEEIGISLSPRDARGPPDTFVSASALPLAEPKPPQVSNSVRAVGARLRPHLKQLPSGTCLQSLECLTLTHLPTMDWETTKDLVNLIFACPVFETAVIIWHPHGILSPPHTDEAPGYGKWIAYAPLPHELIGCLGVCKDTLRNLVLDRIYSNRGHGERGAVEDGSREQRRTQAVMGDIDTANVTLKDFEKVETLSINDKAFWHQHRYLPTSSARGRSLVDLLPKSLRRLYLGYQCSQAEEEPTLEDVSSEFDEAGVKFSWVEDTVDLCGLANEVEAGAKISGLLLREYLTRTGDASE
ncbi:hypothetical protein B0H66DRAFT_534008 [Apodospora peruviana]|uniref:Uncharacterized protein n=1 Tax=Apodospora peruviana TaxID=516989 RepID=A0AAE0M2P5_9PEZI|nr:hypothetical protein B0H66DRAFT_534008 [Apodospora peruviana]